MNASTFKVALRGLVRRKFFTFISLFGIAFTLVVILVASAIVDHAFGSHPPETHGDRSLYVTSVRMKGPNRTSSSGPGYGFLDTEVRDLPGAERVTFFTNPTLAVSYLNGQRVKSFLKRTDASFWEPIGKAHAEVFGVVRPATTFLVVAGLIDPAMVVEIEADAVL